MKPKTIILDAYQSSSAITGTDRMAYNFLDELQKIDVENSYIVICSQHVYIPEIVRSPNFRVLSPPRLRLPDVVVRAINKVWRKFVYLYVSRKQNDVFYSFHNMRLPNHRIAKRMIASNLDLIPVILDEYKNPGKGAEDQKKMYERVVASADSFISISNFSKKELMKVLNVQSEKIKVIPLAADPQFKPKNHENKIIQGDYILTLGGSEPRKNVLTVINAYNQLSASIRDCYKLVVVGGQWHGQQLDYNHSESIVELGYVPDEDLPGLYSNSSVFVFASVYEGFGFTILEAMASGAPVINAQGSSLDEVAGSATLSFNPENPIELTGQLTKILEDENLRRELIEKGYEQERKFSWEESALKLHSILIND